MTWTCCHSMLLYLAYFLVSLNVVKSGLSGAPSVNTTEAKLNKTYNGSVSVNNLDMFQYHYNETQHRVPNARTDIYKGSPQTIKDWNAIPDDLVSSTEDAEDSVANFTSLTTAVRITSVSKSSNSNFPTIFVVRQERSVLSWQIPLMLQYTYEYHSVSRTLCPLDSNIPSLDLVQTFYIEISSLSNTSVPYSMKAEILTDFEIRSHEYKTVTSSPSEPVYYLYTFPEGQDTVVVRAKSDDTKCMTLSVQNVKCPVFDLDKDVEYQGAYQTMTKQGTITVTRASFSDSFYIVLVVKPNDLECSTIQAVHPAGTSVRMKNITLYIEETLPTFQYYKATLAAIGFFLSFYVVALIIGCLYHGCKENYGIIDLSQFDRSTGMLGGSMTSEKHGREENTEVKTPLAGHTQAARMYGAVPNSIASEISRELREDLGRPSYHDSEDNISEDSVGEYDLLPDADKDKNIFRTKTALYVVDLARKSEKKQAKRYKLYTTNLFTISVFYGLPVLQLVFTYQKVLNATGDQDICYYNFACAHPLGRVSSFNNIFSNCGYVMLGVLFLILVARRNFLHRKAIEKSSGRDALFGIPQHFGLFYAMGFALCMEGFMSGCYHVCPTVSNFQFDTSFMYIMACLCILKIYQNRHPDISANSHSAYMVMALIIIVAVLGVLYGTNVFWILFALIYMFVSLILSIHIYYMGRWQLDRYVFKRVFLLVRYDWMRCSRPTYCNRFVLLLIGNAVNWSIALFAAIEGPNDAASLLLAVFICNLLVYCAFYLAMKPTDGGDLSTVTAFFVATFVTVLFVDHIAIVAMTVKFADFASFLLGIFIINLLLYNIFYVASKILMKEKIAKLTIMFILLAMVTWGVALYFFLAHLTSWQLTPAVSREGNKDCILMGFYDAHDVWHFLSAISLFFSFLVLLTLDDEIIFTRRDHIPVF